MEILLTILRILEIIACLTGFILCGRLKGTYWRIFPYYLLFIVLVEAVGRYLKMVKMKEVNFAMYNYLVIPIEFLFFIWIFHQAMHSWRYKWLPALCMVIYGASWIADIAYVSKEQFFFYSFSYTIGNLVLLILIMYYFIKLVSTDAILSFRSDMLFWVSTGLLLYYLGTFPYYGLRNTIAYNYRELNIVYSYTVYILNSLMYLMFTLSFIWGRPNTRHL